MPTKKMEKNNKNNDNISDSQKTILFNYFSNGANEQEKLEAIKLINENSNAKKYIEKFQEFEDINFPKFNKSDDEVLKELKKIEKRVKNNLKEKKNKTKLVYNLFIGVAAVVLVAILIPQLFKISKQQDVQKLTSQKLYSQGYNKFSSGIEISSQENTQYTVNTNEDTLLLVEGRIFLNTNGKIITCKIKNFPDVLIYPIGTKFTIIKKDSTVQIAVLEKQVVYSGKNKKITINKFERITIAANTTEISKDTVDINFFTPDINEYTINKDELDTTLLKNKFGLSYKAIKELEKNQYLGSVIQVAFVVKFPDNNYYIISESGEINEFSEQGKKPQIRNTKQYEKIKLTDDFTFTQKPLSVITKRFFDEFGVSFVFYPEMLSNEEFTYNYEKGDDVGDFIKELKLNGFNISIQNNTYLITEGQ